MVAVVARVAAGLGVGEDMQVVRGIDLLIHGHIGQSIFETI